MSSSGEASPTTNSLSPSTTPNALANQAPKFGTVIPNRIFVGGIATNTTDQELKVFFSAYGAVKDTKIICDRAGVSKGYGFVTFETQEDAEKIIKKDTLNLIFKERKLNIGPAVRKQQAFPRLFDGMASTAGGATMFFTPNPYATYAQNGLALVPGATDCAGFPAIQQQSVAAQPQGLGGYANSTMMFPPQVFMTHPQYQYASPAAATSPAPQQSVTSQASAALQYANQQWTTAARCYQPTGATAAANNLLYQGLQQQQQQAQAAQQAEVYYSAASTPQGQQYVEMADGTMLEQNHNDANRLPADYVTQSRSDTSFSEQQKNATISSLMNLQTRSIPQQLQQSQAPPPQFHSPPVLTTAQPPPMKKLAPMTPLGAHISINPRCYQAAPSYIIKQANIASKARQQQHLSAVQAPAHMYSTTAAPISYITSPATPKIEDLRAKYEQDSQLAASIAPPTPPSTPASAIGH